jgi:hypothetical protein
MVWFRGAGGLAGVGFFAGNSVHLEVDSEEVGACAGGLAGVGFFAGALTPNPSP